MQKQMVFIIRQVFFLMSKGALSITKGACKSSFEHSVKPAFKPDDAPAPIFAPDLRLRGTWYRRAGLVILQMLEQTDSRTGADMPDALLNEWKAYRVLLRDLPANLEAAGVEPNIAYYMFPDAPGAAPE